MNKYIVTTTINSPTEALKKFDAMEDWKLIVIGDTKTPDKELFKKELPNSRYVAPEEQGDLGFKSVPMIPWRLIQRRNIGYLLAIQEGADIIATIDDDNIPRDGWGVNCQVGKHVRADEITENRKGDVRVVNLLQAVGFCDYDDPTEEITDLKIWHRGYPVQRVDKPAEHSTAFRGKKLVGVQADLWDGEPDVDAVCRIAQGPFNLMWDDVRYAIDNTSFAPFNTQNTFFSRELAASMCLPFDIGRMDDIWASYMTQRVMRELDQNVLFMSSSVYQDRNDHDLSKDLEAEMLGYRHTLDFLRALDSADIKGNTSLELYSSVVEEVSKLDFISETMTEFQRAWIEDMDKML